MANSIIQTKRTTCYVCKRYIRTQEHHIFNGFANRKKSEKDGMKLNVCFQCHERIHQDQELDLKLKRLGEIYWLEYYKKEIPDFIKRYGKNYLEE